MSDGPKRHESELTLVIDRSKLPPTSTTQLDVYEAPPTLEACPACADCQTCKGLHHVECPTCGSHVLPCHGACATCSVCLAVHMLTQSEARAWRDAQPEPPRAA